MWEDTSESNIWATSWAASKSTNQTSSPLSQAKPAHAHLWIRMCLQDMCGLFSLTVKLFMLLTPRWSNQLRMLEPLWREVELQGWRWVKVEVTLRARDCLLGRDSLFTLEWVDCIMPLPIFFFLFFWKFSSSTVLVFKMSSYSFSRGLKWLASYKRKKKLHLLGLQNLSLLIRCLETRSSFRQFSWFHPDENIQCRSKLSKDLLLQAGGICSYYQLDFKVELNQGVHI